MFVWFYAATFFISDIIISIFSVVLSYPKSSLRRDYSRRDDVPPPRSRATADYGSRIVPDRRTSYRDDYPSRGPGYSDPPRSTSRPVSRRAYVDDGYGQRFERPPPPPPSYREGRARDYDSISGSKRSYAVMVGATFCIIFSRIASFGCP